VRCGDRPSLAVQPQMRSWPPGARTPKPAGRPTFPVKPSGARPSTAKASPASASQDPPRITLRVIVCAQGSNLGACHPHAFHVKPGRA
jgi:hypothetical protein